MGKKAGLVEWQKTKDYRIKKRRGWYWARFQKGSVMVQESLHTKSFTIAQRACDEIESCIRLGMDWKKEHELFETAWPEFLEDKAKGVKTSQARESTLREYIRMGERYYLSHFKTSRVSDINEELWEDYLTAVMEGNEGKKFFNHWKYMSGFLSWAFRKGKIKEKPELRNPDKRAKDSDEDDGPGKAYSRDEIRAMLTHSSGAFHVALSMAIYMGMRSSEITQLQKARINFDTDMIKLRAVETKNGQPRSVPIHPLVKPLLKDQVNVYKGSPYVFPNRVDKLRAMDPTGFKKPWTALRFKLGIDGRFHDFKHSFITHALKSGMNPVIVAEVVGTSIKVIQSVYLHLTDEDLARDLARLKI